MVRKSIIKGALILTVANIITRILGFIYRVYMSNLIGAEGMGLYQLITPIYMLIWSISSSGFSTTISKLTAQENAKREYGNMGRILKQSMLTSGLIALILSIFTYLFSEYIGINILKDERTITSLKILSLCFPFMALGSCIRGYFFGLQESSIPAVSQVFEQIVRMAVIYFLAGSFITKGIEFASAAAVIGMCAGEILSFLYVLISYKVFKTKNKLNKKPSLNSIKIYALIMAIAIPLTANRVTGSFLSTLENILIPQRLQLFGLTSNEAISIYGKLSGMAMPLIMFPSSLLTALSTALVPAVSEAQAVKNNSRITYAVKKSLLFTSIIGIGASGLFVTFSNELSSVIYNKNQIGELLFIMGLMCPFLYYQVTLSGILNGLGEQVFIFRNSIISSAINIAFVFFLIPVYGINAFIIGWFISLIIVSYLDIKRVIKRTNVKINIMKWFTKPVLAIIVSCLVIKLAEKSIFSIFKNSIALIISVSFVGIMYILILIISDCIEKEDIKSVLRK